MELIYGIGVLYMTGMVIVFIMEMQARPTFNPILIIAYLLYGACWPLQVAVSVLVTIIKRAFV